jgi:hypothetical protein
VPVQPRVDHEHGLRAVELRHADCGHRLRGGQRQHDLWLHAHDGLCDGL